MKIKVAFDVVAVYDQQFTFTLVKRKLQQEEHRAIERDTSERENSSSALLRTNDIKKHEQSHDRVGKRLLKGKFIRCDDCGKSCHAKEKNVRKCIEGEVPKTTRMKRMKIREIHLQDIRKSLN